MAVNHDAPAVAQGSRFNKFGEMYSKYFPTDKETFAVRYSIARLIISLFTLQLFFFFIWFDDGMIFVHAFYVLIASVHFGLYYGLKFGKLRLITPWLIWKVIEIIFTVAVIFVGTISRHYLYRYSVWNIVLAFCLVVADILMMFCLYKSQVESTEVRNFHLENESKKSTPDV